MEPSEENGWAESPGDDQQNLGLGFQSADRDYDEDEEAIYEKRFSEEFEGLVLGEHESERERLGEIEEGFDGGEGFNWGRNGKGYNGHISYPVRPDAEDCAYYMRNGSCKFGSGCKFNHPVRRKNQYPKAAKEKDRHTERPGQIECKYQMTSGGCKYGKACKYSHNRAKTPVNFLGLPIRPVMPLQQFQRSSYTCRCNFKETFSRVGF